MNKCIERLYNGIIKENPTFVLILGMCPTLAVTSSLVNGAGMGLSTMAVLVLSNMVISMLRNIIPNGVRVPAFIVIVASFVTILQFLLEAYLPSFNTRYISRQTFGLSGERLITQLESTTSTLLSGTGRHSISPRRNSTLSRPVRWRYCPIFFRALASISGVMSTPITLPDAFTLSPA